MFTINFKTKTKLKKEKWVKRYKRNHEIAPKI